MKKEKSFLYNFKVKPSLMRLITAKAKKYCEGNVSAWLKRAAAEYDPKD
jgi:hypothetical protein